jgi:holo-[acyl-carrier protein] synthase
MVGIDIVDIARIAGVVERYGDRFLNKVFDPEEIEYAKGMKRGHESLAGRFAAKEAFMKAFGRRLAWRDIKVLQVKGRPFIRFRGKRYSGVSISHERSYAVSIVVIEGTADEV